MEGDRTVAAGRGERALQGFAELIARRFHGGCLIYLRSDRRRTLVPVAAYHSAPRVAASWAEFIGAPSAWTGQRMLALLNAGGTAVVSGAPEQVDAWLGASFEPTSGATGARSVLAVPVLDSASAVVGAIVVGRDDDRRYAIDDRVALEAMARSAADTIESEQRAWELRERVAAESRRARELSAAEERFLAIFRDSPIASALFSLGPGPGQLLEVNRQLAALLGTTEDALRGHDNPGEFMHVEDRASVCEALERLLASEATVATVELRALGASELELLCRCTFGLVRDDTDEPLYGLCQIVDVTAQRRNEARLERHVRCLRALAAIGRRAIQAHTWEQLSASALPALAGALDTEYACVLARTDNGTLEPVAGSAGFALDGRLPPSPTLLDSRRLPPPWLERGARAALVSPLRDQAAPRSWLALLSASEARLEPDDVWFVEAAAHLLAAAEERRDADAEARARTLLDPLTELPNRALFGDRVAHATARAIREQAALAVICIDVDRFTDLNETYGHATGDQLIQQLALRLASVLRTNDTLARIGADEFGVVLEAVGDERGAIEAVRRLMATLEAPVVIDERVLHVTASFGVAVAVAGARADGLLRNADTAMHRAKAHSGTSYELFDRAMRRRIAERLRLEQDLRRALELEQFVLHYQPLVSLQRREIVGVEALVRWQHPEQGTVSPADFVPIAEETGLIVTLGSWVLNEACRQLADWSSDAALPPLYVSVNLSGRQLAVAGLHEEIIETLRRTGVEPQQLALELTETVLMAETSSPAATLQQLHDLGVQLLLDDFGTGYSSLNYIKRFPLHGLKVDRAFISGIPDDQSDRAMVRAITNMAAALDIAVLAEGVETLEQASWLASVDCDVAQGFGLARPAPAEAIGPLLRDGLPSERLRWSLEPPSVPALAEASSEPTVPLSEAAEALGISASTLRRWTDTGRIKAIRTPGGHRRFPVSEVRRLTVQAGARPRGTLRSIELPAAPIAPFAELLQSRPDLIATAAVSIYRPGKQGWFASEAASAAITRWTRDLAAAARSGQYDAALHGTQRLLAQAERSGATLLERHQWIERLRDVWLRQLIDRRVPRGDLLQVRRLLTRLSYFVLEDPADR